MVDSTSQTRDLFANRVCRWGAIVSIALIVVIASVLLYVANIQKFLSKQDVYVLGSKTLVPGSRASMRVVVADKGADHPIENARVSLALKGRGLRTTRLSSGQTDRAGTLGCSFTVPAGAKGECRLLVTASSSRGKDVLQVPVQLEQTTRTMLTTDRPVYQPGQTIHLRTLTLQQPSLAPSANRKLRMIIEDPRKNKVYDKTITTGKWGIASADFQLGDEINSGRYLITATAGGTEISRTVNVKPYTLPRFKLNVATDRTYYMPGQNVRGTLSAQYFFGKPVSGARVRVSLSVPDGSSDKAVKVSGATNSRGEFTFSSRLPDISAAKLADQGSGNVRIAASVTDGAGHTEEVTQPVTLAKEPVRIALVPESGQLVPGMENVVYVVTSFPDGRPARTRTTLTINGEEHSAETDKLGVASFKIVPRPGTAEVAVGASTPDGVSGSQTFKPEITSGVPEEFKEYYEFAVQRGTVSDLDPLGSLLVRTDRAIYKTGDTARVTVLSTKQSGEVYIDVARDGQTLLTRTASLKHGKAQANIDIPEDCGGTLTFSAYVLSRLGVPVRDTASVLVRNADGLNVAVKPDSEACTPGGKVRLSFNVTDSKGRGVPAAVGVNIVDESVFSVEERMPGLSALYFALRKDVLRPAYQGKQISEDLFRRSYRDPEGSARAIEKCMLSPRSHISGSLPGWKNPEALFASDDTATIQRAAKVLFASAIGAAEPEITAITQQTKDQMARRVQRSVLGGYGEETMHWLLIIAYMLLLGAMVWTAYRSRRPYTMTITVLPIAVFALLLFTAVAGANSDYSGSFIYMLRDWSILLLIVSTVAAMFAVARLSDSWIKIIVGLGVLVFLAAIIFPIFARARESARSSSFGADLRMLQSIVEENPVASAAPRREGQGAPRVRQFFPETLYSNPALITDERGRGSVNLTLADSITTWRISATANSMNGRIGSSDTPLRVFQDFFIEPDLPTGVTQGDVISVPVAVYNYLPKPQSVKLALKDDNWYRLTGPGEQQVALGPNEVGVAYFPLKAAELGRHSLTIEARSASAADAVKRELTVNPNGQRRLGVANGVASRGSEAKLFIPRNAIPGATKMFVKFYPGVLSQIIDGLDALLQVPHGCFEQTSSTTYPNVLVAKYLGAAKKDNAKAMAKAREFIDLGYQKLLSFEVEGGGFDWYGKAPADTILTAYGIMEFTDMADVTTVDKSVIGRARRLLESRQKSDGSWDAGHKAYTWDTLDSSLSVTAYVVWALCEAGFGESDAARRGCAYLKEHLDEIQDPYAAALTANAFIARGHDESVTATLLDRLNKSAVVHEDRASWQSSTSTLTYGYGDVATTETTALAANAFLKSHTHSTRAHQALNQLTATRGSNGGWYTTQATILALKALVAGVTEGTGGKGSVDVMVNGHKAGTVKMNGSGADVVRTVNATGLARPDTNTVNLVVSGKPRPAYQVITEHYIPWEDAAKPAEQDMRLDVSYSRLRVKRESTVDVTARISAVANPVKMAIAELGVAPGFGVVTDDLDSLQSRNIIDRYELTPGRITLYLRDINPGSPVTIRYELRALYPVEAQVPPSRVYDYYNPSTNAHAAPTTIQVL